MFSKIFKYLKSYPLLPHVKQKFRIFLAKDLKQYRVEYHNIIMHSIGNLWPFGIKNLNIKNIFYSLFVKFFFLFLFVVFIFYIFYKLVLFLF